MSSCHWSVDPFTLAFAIVSYNASIDGQPDANNIEVDDKLFISSIFSYDIGPRFRVSHRAPDFAGPALPWPAPAICRVPTTEFIP